MSNAKLMLLSAVVVTLAAVTGASVVYAETEKGISKNNPPRPDQEDHYNRRSLMQSRCRLARF